MLGLEVGVGCYIYQCDLTPSAVQAIPATVTEMDWMDPIPSYMLSDLVTSYLRASYNT